MKQMQKWLSVKNIALFFLALAIIFLSVYAISGYQGWIERENRENIRETLRIFKRSTESIVNTRISLIEGLSKFATDRTGREIERDFLIFAPGLHNNIPGLRNVGIAPGGILKHIYPVRGNEQAVGLNLLEDPSIESREAATKAVESKKVVVSDPFQLRQGGLGMTARKAIYKNNELWGLVSLVIDVPVIVELSGLMEGRDVASFALRTSDGVVFWGEKSVFDQFPEVEKIVVGDVEWDLAGVITGGWVGNISPSFDVFVVVISLLGIIIWSLASLSISRRTGLEIAEEGVEKYKGIKIVAIYLLVSLLWILLSDRALVALFSNPTVVNQLQTAKGITFVLISALMIWWLIEVNYGKYLITSKALRSIIEGNRLLMRVKDETELFKGLCDELVNKAGYDMAWIGMANNKEKKIDPVGMAGSVSGYFEEIEFGWGVGEPLTPCALSVWGGKTVIINNVYEVKEYPEWRLAAEKRNFKSMISVPLIDKEGSIGMLAIYSSKTDAFSYGDIELLTSFANDLVFGLRVLKFNKLVALQKQKLESILRDMGDAVFVTDEAGEILLVNRAMEKITGIGSREMVGKFYRHIRIKYEKTGNSGEGIFREMLKKGKIVTPSENMVLIDDKNVPVPIDFVGSPLIDELGKVTGSVVVIRDVTNQRKTEKIKSDFVSMASHQLRSPLTGIKWLVELLLEGKEKMKPQKAQEYIEKIGESNEKLIDLVNDLLVTSRIEEGKYDKRSFENVRLKDMLRDAYSDVERLYVGKDIKITGIEEIVDTLRIEVDRIQIIQVFTNILANAGAYSPKRSVVKVKAIKDNKEITISFKDQGYGIPKDQQKKIFEKFFRADNVAKKIQGTGLGMYMSKNIIEGHGGKIWFKSVEKKGTEFFVKLPIKQKKDG